MAAGASRGNGKRRITADALWYKDAVIYQLHVRSFCDSNGDGIGDFPGLTSKLDYLQDLGVTALWVMPFYPSPLKDDGYDIADYYEINPIYGTLDEFRTFLDEAHQRSLRVITELVINHTSDQNVWFQKSRRAMQRLAQANGGFNRADGGAARPPLREPLAKVGNGGAHPDDFYREYYVWTQDPTRYKEVRIIFKDFEPSNWTWDPIAQAYYWHRFFSHQPDLNFDNPCVHDEILRAINYWCDMGVDGFRLDAIPYLYEREGTSGESLPETHAFLKKLRTHVDEKYGDRVFLAEANQWPEESINYFGSGAGDECHMAFHFPVMPRLFMSVRMEDRVPLVDIIEQTPPLPETAQWAIFLRNHDELTLEMVTDEERDYMYRMYAHESKARINLGIRRRLAPLLGNDRNRIELLNMLLLSLPGTPVIYYGDEIGMGDNIYLGDRNGVRTPMHWSSDKNAGFSRASPQALQLPIIIDPEYHYEAINVEAQQRNPNSLLWWMKRVIALRKRWQAFGRGTLEFLSPANRKVLAFVRRFENETLLVVANLSRFPQPVELDLSPYKGIRPRELFGRTKFPAIAEGPYLLTLHPHGAFWFSIEARSEAVDAAQPEAPVVLVEENWREFLVSAARAHIESSLPEYLRPQRWFAGRGREIESVAVSDCVALGESETAAVMTLVQVNYVASEPETYFLPLAFVGSEGADAIRHNPLHRVILELRGSRDGIIYDASVAESFGWPAIEAVRSNRKIPGDSGDFVFRSEPAGKELLAEAKDIPISIRSDFNNTSLGFGDRLFAKWFRRLEPGTQPEIELVRFLSAQGFSHLPRLAGTVEYRAGTTLLQLGMVSEFIPNAVTAWSATLDALSRFFDRVRTLPPEDIRPQPCPALLRRGDNSLEATSAVFGTYPELARLLGQRTGEMHVALASDPDNREFAPEPFTPFYQRSLYHSMRNVAVEVLDTLKQQADTLPEPARSLAARVLPLQAAVLARLQNINTGTIASQRIRIHGDYHLAQVLYTGKDFIITDFEGEWSRPMSERRIKRSPLRDVVSMIRSFSYIAPIALRREQERGHIGMEHAEVMPGWVQFWTRTVSGVFLRSYLETVSPALLLPQDEAHLDTLLQLLLLDRTLNELGHELANRPESAHIPLQSLLELVAPG